MFLEMHMSSSAEQPVEPMCQVLYRSRAAAAAGAAAASSSSQSMFASSPQWNVQAHYERADGMVLGAFHTQAWRHLQ